MEYTHQQLQRIANYRKQKGQQIKENAAYSGRMDDGKGSLLIVEADAFACGLENRLPHDWIQDAEECIKQDRALLDPDYGAYKDFLKRNPGFKGI